MLDKVETAKLLQRDWLILSAEFKIMAMTKINCDQTNGIQGLEWNEHIRLRSEMYIGKVGDGTDPEDGIYTLLKGLIECSISEFKQGVAKDLEIDFSGLTVSLREYGRGIPLESVVSRTSGLHVGMGAPEGFSTLNGYKVANAFAEKFLVNSYRNGERSWAQYSKGVLFNHGIEEDKGQEPMGTWVQFNLDTELFPGSYYRLEIVRDIVRQYAKDNPGFSIYLHVEKL